jgi:septal ring factor EnvC (AmiA/AmiB activator)
VVGSGRLAAGRRAAGARSLVRLLAAGCLALTLASPASLAHADALTDLKARIAQAQNTVRDLTLRRQGQQAVVEQLRGETGAYAAELRKIDAELLAAVGRFREAEAGLAAVEVEVEQLEEQIAEKELAVQQRASVYGTRLRALYKFTRTSPLEQLLAARSFSDALRRVTAMQAVTRVDNRLLGQLRDEHEELVRARRCWPRSRRRPRRCATRSTNSARCSKPSAASRRRWSPRRSSSSGTPREISPTSIAKRTPRRAAS